MCGHGTIGTITIAIEEGLIQPKTEGVVRMEAPAGLVLINYKMNGSKVSSVKLTNVPSYLAATDLKIDCPGLGELTVDVAYGGNFYAIVDEQTNFGGIQNYTAAEILHFSPMVRNLVNQVMDFVHPLDKTIRGCSHVLWTGTVLDPASTARNAVFYGDKAIDRSPCGTGTSARMAQWYSKGRLRPGDKFIHESIIGSKFIGTIEEETTVAGFKAIRPGIEGWAKIYGHNIITIDKEDDPYAHGFQVI